MPDDEFSATGELKRLRSRLQEKLEHRDETAGSLQQDVHVAFSKLRQCAIQIIKDNSEKNRQLLVAAADAAEASHNAPSHFRPPTTHTHAPSQVERVMQDRTLLYWTRTRPPH